jgi:polar amino acid transport system substrate-binding protein
VIQPEDRPAGLRGHQRRPAGLAERQVDAILADLPTAFFISAVEIPNSTIVGQFQPETGQQEEFGMLFEKGSDLVPCVNEALAALRERTARGRHRKRWLADRRWLTELK